MLFHPSANQKLDAVTAQLGLWDGEADRFRRAAVAARHGEAPAQATVAAAETVHDELMILLDELDRAVEGTPAGQGDFRALLGAQRHALALLESVTSSLEVLDRCLAVHVAEPTALGRSRLAVASE